MNSLKKHPCRQNNPLVPFSPNTKGSGVRLCKGTGCGGNGGCKGILPANGARRASYFPCPNRCRSGSRISQKPSARKIFSGSLPGKRLCLSPSRQLAEIPLRQKVPGRIRPSNLLRYHLCLTCRTAHLNFLLH